MLMRENAEKLLMIFSGPLHLVNFGLYSKCHADGGYSYQVACWTAEKFRECDDLTRSGYSRMESFQTILHSKTDMTLEVAGNYSVQRSPLKLK